MATSTFQSILLTCACMLLVAGPSSVQAQYFVEIRNPNNFEVNYELNGQLSKAPPSNGWRHEGANFFIRFDADFSNGPQIQSYSLRPNSRNEFRQNGNRLDLIYTGDLPQAGQGSVPPPQGPITASANERVETERYADTRVVLYPNGPLTIQTYTDNQKYFYGFRCYVFVICKDSRGRQLWVTKPNKCTTRGGLADGATHSSGTDVFQHNVPPVVAAQVRSIDIYHFSYNPDDFAKQWVRNIKTAVQAYMDLPPEARTAIQVGMAWAGL